MNPKGIKALSQEEEERALSQYLTSKETVREVAARFKVSERTLYRIRVRLDPWRSRTFRAPHGPRNSKNPASRRFYTDNASAQAPSEQRTPDTSETENE